MSPLERVFELFPSLSADQQEQFAQLESLYKDWNAQINVISRKDIDTFYTRHVLHSLCIAHYHDLSGLKVLDVGTGGGFPGVPLAIYFPDASFTLADSIGKKLKVVRGVCESIGLSNVKTVHSRMEELKGRYDVITGRAVKPLPMMREWTRHLTDNRSLGMLYLKGGDFSDELKALDLESDVEELKSFIPDIEFFETKKLVHLY